MTAELLENISLQPLNTLRFDVAARYLAVIDDVESLTALLADSTVARLRKFVLGGGSNVLFSKDFDGIVLKMNIKGIAKTFEDDSVVHLEVGAGEEWQKTVEYAVANGWGGIENLAMVPGTAGAAPIQNIACYGHNLHETLVYADAICAATGRVKRFSAEECKFGYRSSVFNGELKGQYILVRIAVRLQKYPVLNTSYRSRYESVEDEMAKGSSPPYAVADVYRAIINIRQRKLPAVNELGTAGSVFKNPVITRSQLSQIQQICPGIHYYPEQQLTYNDIDRTRDSVEPLVKIPAAWLIEDMGWAGRRVGKCGIWKSQPLNIVNYGGATPAEFLALMADVQEAVLERYGVRLEPEVVIV